MYKQVDDEVARAAVKVIKRHLWYLAPETVVLALFSSKVSDVEKGAIAERLLATPRPEVHVVGGNESVALTDDQPVCLATS